MSSWPVDRKVNTVTGTDKPGKGRRNWLNLFSRRPGQLCKQVFRAAKGCKPASGQLTSQTVHLLRF